MDLGEGLYEFKSFKIRMIFAYCRKERAVVVLTHGFNTSYALLMQDPAFRKNLAVEALVLEAAEVVSRLMMEQDKSRAWVTQLLNGSANMTVRTLAELRLAAQPACRKQELKPKQLRGYVAPIRRDAP